MRKTLKTAPIFAIMALLVFCIFFTPTMTASASSKTRTYKVGANVMFGVTKTDAGYTGLACDYLNAISRYTGDKFEYVEGTEEQLFRMLKTGEIDIIPCATESERAYYEMLLMGSGIGNVTFTATRNALISRFGAVYVYDKGAFGETIMNDVSTIRRMKIGYLKSDYQRYFVSNRLIYSEIDGASFAQYQTEEEMRADFVSGKIDAVIKDCFRPWSDETAIYVFPAKRGFFITRTGDPVFDKLENGLTELFMSQPTFYGSVYEKYVSNYGARKFAYDAEESEFLKNHGEITLAFNLETDIMQCYNSKSGKLEGVVGSFIEAFSETTGLEINVKPFESLDECYAALNNREADIIYGGVHGADGGAFEDNYHISAPALNFPLVLAGKEGTELGSSPSVAVNSGSYEAINSLARVLPDANIIYSDSVTTGCDMAVKGNCGAVCLNGYDAIYLKSNGYPELEILEVLPAYSIECFALRGADKGLCGITESALARINGSEVMTNVHNLLEAEEYATKPKMNIWMIIAAFGGLVVITALGLILINLRNKRRAEVDPLTGGYTKRSFIAEAEKTIKRSGTKKWAMAVFDIDKFKFINDHLGYEEGNRMLERIHKTLGDHMEPDEPYARISDDIFACCVHGASDEDLSERLNEVFEEFDRRNSLFVSYPVVFSAGVCRLEQCTAKYGSVDLNMAIDRCNIAKKTIKELHATATAFYDGAIRDKTLRERDLENVMPSALDDNEFLCFIQPKYGARTRKIEGGEALIRWKSSEFGFIYPDEFIPVSEKTGFVVELDFFILEEVCKAMRRWLDKGHTPVVISVNQSRLHMSHDDYIWRLREIVDKYAIPYEYIELEITETVFTDNAELLLKIMQKLHEIGFKLSIDDFGSGYSSLNMLKDMPADVVKIDREFFNGTVNSDKGRAVITTVVDLAKKLKMHVISEGVETLDQVEFLDKINCDMIQGYYFARPMPINEFETLWFKELGEAEGEAG
ncbi:MAG: EAL domain-containing protein [Oscillospiraceae bacterium]|nr:EAL domain-containing protein [Oscillospiraceae bacterium]